MCAVKYSSNVLYSPLVYSVKSGIRNDHPENVDDSSSITPFDEPVLEYLLGKELKQYRVLQQSQSGGSSYLPQRMW